MADCEGLNLIKKMVYFWHSDNGGLVESTFGHLGEMLVVVQEVEVEIYGD